MKYVTNFIFTLFLGLFASGVSSQEVVGSAIISGKTIEILDDQTWRYKTSKKPLLSSCDAFELGIHFCNDKKWKSVEPTGDVNHMYQVDGRTYVIFIIEPMGSNDGVTSEFMAEVALGYAAGDAGVENVPQHFSRYQDILGRSVLSLGYTANLSGMNFTFLNNIFVTETVTVQAAIYVIGSEITDDQEVLNDLLLNSVFFND
ncbi:hypothetical protein N9L08_05075 [Rhodobacteraceae bacterium]|nr:hypothetical protein [Paracoccaceae bacterium]